MADRATHLRERSASVEEAYERHSYDEYRALIHRLEALRVPSDERDDWLKRVAEYDDLLTTVPTSLPFKKYKTLEHATAFCIWSLLPDEWQEHFWLVLTDAAVHAQPTLDNLHPARDDEIVQQIQVDLSKKAGSGNGRGGRESIFEGIRKKRTVIHEIEVDARIRLMQRAERPTAIASGSAGERNEPRAGSNSVAAARREHKNQVRKSRPESPPPRSPSPYLEGWDPAWSRFFDEQIKHERGAAQSLAHVSLSPRQQAIYRMSHAAGAARGRQESFAY